MKTIIIFCGMMLFFSTVNGQNKYTYKPKASNEANNTKTYQFNAANSQNNNAAPVNNNQSSTSNNPRQTVQYEQVPKGVKKAGGWVAFRNSSLGKLRQVKFANTFNNPSHLFRMDDGSKLTVNFQKNPSYGGIANQVNTQSSPGAPVHNGNQGGWTCTASNVQISAKTTDFNVADYSLQSPHIYPGAIYTFENYINGSYISTPGARNPVRIFTDSRNIHGNNFVLIANPNQQTLQNAIAQLSQRFPTNQSGNGATDFAYYESDNSADMALKATAGGSGYGFTFNAAFGESNNSRNLYLTIDVKKAMFSINTLPPQNGYYSDASVESTPNLLTIGEVTYGIRILANITMSISSDSMAAALKAGFTGMGFSGNLGFSYVQQHSGSIQNINAYEIGGPNVGAVQIDKNHLLRSINKILAGATYQNAMPIDYQLFDMAGDVIGSSSATDQFVQQTCAPTPGANTPLLTSAVVSVNCGVDCKDGNTHYQYYLYNGEGNQIGSLINNSDNTEWINNKPNQGNDHIGISNSPRPKLTDFTQGDPELDFTIHPTGGLGHDDVNLSQLFLTLTFTSPDGSSSKNYQVTFSNVEVNQDAKTAKLIFNYTGAASDTFMPIGQNPK